MFRLRSSKKLWLASLLLLLLPPVTTCRSTPPRREVAAVPTDEVTVVDDGDSTQPSVSPDGHRLLFVSAKRPAHVAPQVYVKDLDTRIERRVTYQNGVVARPRFHPRENVIVYASSTDEDKENPSFLREQGKASVLPTWLRQAAEIYEHDLGTFDIKRLGVHLGFDGDPRYVRRGRALTWTRANDETTAIVTMARGARTVSEVRNLGPNPTDYAASEDDRTAAWVSYDKKFDRPRLMLRQWNKSAEIAIERRTLKTDVSFSPDGIFLLWAEFDVAKNAFVLYARNLLNDCSREVAFATPGSRRHPSLSPDGTLYYTAVGPDRARVVAAKFVAPRCP